MHLPVTYYPVPTQDLFEHNAQRIKDKPYAKYFNGDLWLHDDVMPAIRHALPPSAALSSRPEDINRLLDPGYHEFETGFGVSEQGTPYVASLTRFPGCTPEMFTWWFWWHSVEPERYSLWYPHNHLQAIPRNQDVLTQPGLTDEQRYIGNTHDIVEYLGPMRAELVIEFVDPSAFGMDTSRFAQAGYRAHACGYIRDGLMLHLVRETPDGFELRSRYIFDRGEKPTGDVPAGAREQALAFAYELVLHDQIEFTHLSTFLADIYHEFSGDPAAS
ncbi:hypothetical protein FB565_006128 [Actinoplanes lutulentus]|uniref:DAPG hydrolase PhiG domain-containing protein n=1 Tax=Actinoplanes lutulentus TaxID=1287878 RepID=A0A327Z1R8_9ACTN|nr:hypothetical protein [Actinoplanes lutulentus]MBB2946360.1 hypothetical protein [Actinoplanes lutulentus]RAK28700.1 hypothetical protein B0I29_11937 [Actinoplanes lutulentus]